MAASKDPDVFFTANHSWGVASARHVSGLPVNELPFTFDAPLGPSVVRWDLRNGERVKRTQIHSDLIVCMRYSPNDQYIATASTGGEVKVWSRSSWDLIAETIAPIVSLFHLSWSPSSDCILIIGNGRNSSALLYKLEDVKMQEDGEKLCKERLTLLWRTRAGLSETRESTIESHDQRNKSHDQGNKSPDQLTGRDYSYKDAFYMGEVNPSRTVFIVEEREESCTLLHLLDEGTGLPIKTTPLSSLSGTREAHTLMMSSLHDGLYALMVEGGYVVMVTGEELDIINIYNIGFSSRTCAWDKDLLLLPSDSGKLTWINVQDGSKVQEIRVGSSDYIVHVSLSSSSDLWLCGFSRLLYCTVERNDNGIPTKVTATHQVSTHEISCCGVSFSPSSSLLSVGDLAGNVYLYSCSEDMYIPLEMWNVGGSVRCLCWLDNDYVLVGSLDGSIHLWRVGGDIKPILSMEGGIIHIRCSSNGKYFAVGTSSGKVGVYLYNKEGGVTPLIPCPVSVFMAHYPRPDIQDSRFGQLGHQAEVWSLCWDPTDRYLATCSEDQTVRIWKAESWVGVATLKGHTLAVTSVDWSDVNGRSLLASCSDDRTIRLYQFLLDGESFDLLFTMNTKSIYGWHTLTYLTFKQQPDKSIPLLVVTTQHGYIVLFNIINGSMVSSHKMHCGSIEGCVTDRRCGQFATVGGDCAAYLWSLNI